MIAKKNSRRILALAAVVTMTAAACGSDSNDAADTVVDEPVATEAMEEPVATDAMEEPASTDAMAEDGPFGPACDAVPTEGEGSFAGMTDDPAATAASNNPLLSTLVTAVTEAGLVDTLNSDGPFTIFAPTNDAFAAIPEEDLAAVLADTELLTSILTLHVVPGQSLDAAGLGEAGSLETVNGESIEFGADGTTVNGVDVLCSNVPVANGTVHIIGEVLMPSGDAMEDEAMEEEPATTDAMEEEPATTDAMEEEGAALAPSGPLCEAVPADGEGSFAGMTDDPAGTAASNNPALSTLVAAVVEAGLVDTLNSDGPFTIFAPANPAFEALGEDAVAAVLADTELLTSILTLHVVAGEQLSSADLAELDSVTTVNGQDITLEVADDGTLSVNGQATVGCADVSTANATVHIIDAVLMPSA
ncbi:MAG: fasciclin domain-containing protein [Ilumatobacter sp.]|uniref:fasciclin domain-containing protein n=1 Tax=Ilumatobacter sp. TaxID=1967498 RepID=UPI003299D314